MSICVEQTGLAARRPAVVYDTISSTQTVETSLRLLATGGTHVVSGVEPGPGGSSGRRYPP